MDTRVRRILLATVIAFAAISIAAAAGVGLLLRLSRHDQVVFKKVRLGEVTEASAIGFAGHGRSVELTDSQTVDYFLKALRRARRPVFQEDVYGGLGYTIHV